jgi:hypothetical protein
MPPKGDNNGKPKKQWVNKEKPMTTRQMIEEFVAFKNAFFTPSNPQRAAGGNTAKQPQAKAKAASPKAKAQGTTVRTSPEAIPRATFKGAMANIAALKEYLVTAKRAVQERQLAEVYAVYRKDMEANACYMRVGFVAGQNASNDIMLLVRPRRTLSEPNGLSTTFSNLKMLDLIKDATLFKGTYDDPRALPGKSQGGPYFTPIPCTAIAMIKDIYQANSPRLVDVNAIPVIARFFSSSAALATNQDSVVSTTILQVTLILSDEMIYKQETNMVPIPGLTSNDAKTTASAAASRN